MVLAVVSETVMANTDYGTVIGLTPVGAGWPV